MFSTAGRILYAGPIIGLVVRADYYWPGLSQASRRASSLGQRSSFVHGLKLTTQAQDPIELGPWASSLTNSFALFCWLELQACATTRLARQPGRRRFSCWIASPAIGGTELTMGLFLFGFLRVFSVFFSSAWKPDASRWQNWPAHVWRGFGRPGLVPFARAQLWILHPLKKKKKNCGYCIASSDQTSAAQSMRKSDARRTHISFTNNGYI